MSPKCQISGVFRTNPFIEYCHYHLAVCGVGLVWEKLWGICCWCFMAVVPLLTCLPDEREIDRHAAMPSQCDIQSTSLLWEGCCCREEEGEKTREMNDWGLKLFHFFTVQCLCRLQEFCFQHSIWVWALVDGGWRLRELRGDFQPPDLLNYGNNSNVSVKNCNLVQKWKHCCTVLY